MAINPPSDIVLDVAKAADPLAYRAAVDKLARIGTEAAGPAAAAFEEMLSRADSPPAAEPLPPTDWRLADLRARLTEDHNAQTASRSDPYRQFEAFVLQTFIESMLPKDANHVFGEGIAGSFWSSMLAEQIAKQMAEAGGLGIADTLTAPSSTRAAPDGFSSLPGFVSSLEMRFADALFSADQSNGEGSADA